MTKLPFSSKNYLLDNSRATLFPSQEYKLHNADMFIPTVEELRHAIKQSNVIENITPGIFGNEVFVISLKSNATKQEINETRELLNNILFRNIKNIEFAESKPANTLSLNTEDHNQFMENYETLKQERRMSMEAMR